MAEWTTETPTEEGWYWYAWTAGEGGGFEVFKVCSGLGIVAYFIPACEESVDPDTLNGHWKHIEPPEPPEVG